MSAVVPFLQTGLGQQLHLSMMEERVEPGASFRARPSDARLTYRLLVADDDPSIRQLCRFALKAEDLQCDEARDGAQALSPTSAHPYHILLLDVELPWMTRLH